MAVPIGIQSTVKTEKNVVIGSTENSFKILNPTITGGYYGLSVTSEDSWEFYSGKLRGHIKGCNVSVTLNYPANSSIKQGTESYEGTIYNTTTLDDSSDDNTYNYSIKENGEEIGYPTLFAATEAASDNQTIILNQDAIDDYGVKINKNITLDLQGNTITRSQTIVVNSGCTLTIKGPGTISSDSSLGVIRNSGVLNINGGDIIGTTIGITNGTSSDTTVSATVTVNDGTITGGTYGIYNYNSATSSSYAKYTYVYSGKIIGGTFGIYNYGSSTSKNYAYTFIGKNSEAISTVLPIVTGGTYGCYTENGNFYFYNGILKGTENGYNIEPTGTRSTGGLITNGLEIIDAVSYVTCYFGEGNYSISNSSVKYNTLSAAVLASSPDSTITLLHDTVDLAETSINQNVTLDLKGYTLTRTTGITVNSSKSLTITGEETGKITSSSAIYMITNNGTLNIKGGIIESTISSSSYGPIYNRANLIVEGGTVSGVYRGICNGTSSDTNVVATATINGGTIEATSTYSGYGIYNYSYATSQSYPKTVYLYGGVVKGGKYGIYNYGRSATYNYAYTYIGDSDDNVSTVNPVVSGGERGLFNSNGCWYFNGGLLRGTMFGYNGIYSSVRAGFAPSYGTDTEGNSTYMTCYLTEGVGEGSGLYRIYHGNSFVSYNTLNDAIVGASDEGDTIKVISNLTDSTVATVNKNITLDIGTYTITRSNSITVGEGNQLNIIGSTGKITSTSTVIVNCGELNIEGGTLNNISYSSWSSPGIYNKGLLKINGGMVEGPYYGIKNGDSVTADMTLSATVIMNGGTVRCRDASESSSGDSCGIYNYNYATDETYTKTVYVYGGTVEGGVHGIYNYMRGSALASIYVGNGETAPDESKPTISGNCYGIYNNSCWYFNGGLIKGKLQPYNRKPTAIRTGFQENIISDDDYKISYLSNSESEEATYINIISNPQDKIGATGEFVTLSVGAVSDGKMYYQWYKSSVDSTTSGFLINGATSSTYTIPSLSTPDEGYYYCKVSAGSVQLEISSTAHITIENNYGITTGGLTYYYGELRTALSAAQNGQTINVYKNIENDTSEIRIDKKIYLNIKEFTLKRVSTIYVEETGELTLQGTGGIVFSETGKYTSMLNIPQNSNGIINIEGNLILESNWGVIYLEGNGVNTDSYYGTLNISAGTLRSTGNEGTAVTMTNSNHVLTMTGREN